MGLFQNYTFKITLSIVLGVLTFFAGMCLGFVSLISVPVKEVNVIPAEERRDEGVFYLRKGMESVTGARWRLQRNQVLNAQLEEVRFSEPDLNDWAKTHFDSGEATDISALLSRFRGENSDPPASEADVEGGNWMEKYASQARVTPPNFAIEGGQLQISTAFELMKTASPRDRKRFIYHVKGSFEEVDGAIRFVVSNGFLGAVPLYHIPLIGPAFHDAMLTYFSSFEEWEVLSGAAGTVSSIEVVDGELVLTLRRES